MIGGLDASGRAWIEKYIREHEPTAVVPSFAVSPGITWSEAKAHVEQIATGKVCSALDVSCNVCNKLRDSHFCTFPSDLADKARRAQAWLAKYSPTNAAVQARADTLKVANLKRMSDMIDASRLAKLPLQWYGAYGSTRSSSTVERLQAIERRVFGGRR